MTSLGLEQKEYSPEAGKFNYEIQQRGYSVLEHNIPNDMIEELVYRYADFTLNHPDPSYQTMSDMLSVRNIEIDKKLDLLNKSKDKEITWHKYRTNVEGIGKPDGYTNRSLQEKALLEIRGVVIPPEDPKEFIHYTPGMLYKIRQEHKEFKWGSVPQEVIDLDKAFLPIHELSRMLILKTCALIEETYPDVGKYVTKKSLLTSPNRLIFYHKVDNKKLMLGGEHYDKSFLTVQPAESHLGLRIAKNEDSDLEDVVRGTEYAAVFFGKSFEDAYGIDSVYTPGWHDIYKTNIPNEGRFIPKIAENICARWALIFFANRTNFVNPDKARMHKR